MKPSYFGKLSTRADFVRFNASGAPFRAMDAWIQEGLRFLESQRIENVDALYDAAGPSCFVIQQADGSGALVGGIRPSRDVSGRKYPFFIAAEARSGISSKIPISRLIYRLSDSMKSMASAVDDAVAGLTTAEQLEFDLQAIWEPVHEHPGDSTDYTIVLDNVQFGDFCAGMWGMFQDSRKYAAFKHLLDILLPLRDSTRTRPTYGLRFPLIEGELLTTSVCFWLEVCLRLLADSTVTPTVIFNVRQGPDGDAPGLYLNFSNAPASGFSHVLQLRLDLENLFQVDALGSRSAADIALSIPERYGRLIETRDISLLQFLRSLD